MTSLARGYRAGWRLVRRPSPRRAATSSCAQRPALERLEARLLLAANDPYVVAGPSKSAEWSDIAPASLSAILGSSGSNLGPVSSVPVAVYVHQTRSSNAATPPATTLTVTTPGGGSATTTTGAVVTIAQPPAPPEYVTSADGTTTVDGPNTPRQPFDPETAEALPDGGQFSVVGTLNPAAPPPVFLLPLDPGAEAVIIDVHPVSPGQLMPDHMLVLDASGQKLIESLTDLTSNTIHLELVTGDFAYQGDRPRALFLEFVFSSSSSSSAGTNPPPILGSTPTSGPNDSTFVLSVERQPIPLAPFGIGRPFSPLVASTFAGSITFFSGGTGSSAASNAQVQVISSGAIESDGTGSSEGMEPVRIATGPLPARSAAPLGGILTGGDDDPAPVVSRAELAAVDHALADLADIERERAGGSEAALTVDGAFPASPEEAVVALKGPGGFPLMAPSLITGGQVARRGVVNRLPTISFARSEPELPADSTEVPALPPPPPDAPTTGSTPGPRRSPTVRCLSALTGMSLALAFVSSAVLPDPKPPDSLRRSWLRRFLANS